MTKLKQSVAVQRQIPQHVRDNYPAFVEFIKLYYEFLEETQSQNLEKIRDLETTLEEFIDRFKLELAKNVPIEMSNDRRLLLQHIREFYLSRGSEDSFKFVFKSLFGKDADLFYPSTQMLRVSDGKWQQEIAVFVRLTGSTTSLFPLAGRYINIITPRKTIQTFVENVNAYNELTYEVLIQRDYANEITVGSTIRYVDTDGTIYTGVIVPCPSKIKVYKQGKGFRVGQLFSLKTSIGNGCLVKITKVNSDGGIVAVQPIKFGLDYVSRFYSYLSNKDMTAYEYMHPLKIHTTAQTASQVNTANYTASPTNGTQTFAIQYYVLDGVPLVAVTVTRNGTKVNVSFSGISGTALTVSGLIAGDVVNLVGYKSPGYIDPYGDFVEFGFASKQTYMDYDTTINVANESFGADRYFVDASYVGDIVQQFYTDSTNKLDEDLAIIEIEIGAVARYPGYYRTSDGFISDEMYIQDGKYYQAFSYVIRVEEELRKYADIIKALVHPAGMKMFAEYNLFNEIIVSAGVPNVFRLLQFSDEVTNIFDQGENYTIYENDEPLLSSSKVFSNIGKAVLIPRKNFFEEI
jgi:hypothetical protein